ncbi:ATP-binding protein [Streptomyces sp. NPDC058953]|uniref:ATP-binding protein n=1 Tax=unclassified Streptomyces TaxID=2593676 RepID=UPI0036C4B99E
MAPRPLTRIMSSGTARLARSRELARSATNGATDVLHPLIVISRGLRELTVSTRRRWADTPKEKRGPALFFAGAGVLVVAFVPYGPLTALISVMAAAAWKGRAHGSDDPDTGPDEAAAGRLQALYEALVPYFAVPDDPAPLFTPGGRWDSAFSDAAFDEAGRLTALRIRYPAYFTDGEAASRARIEQVLHAKSGRGREYRFDWDEEGNELVLGVLPALPTTVVAQHFVTAPGETVLGFTDAGAVRRTLPVTDEGSDGTTRDAPPVIWRTGPRSAEPHLLVVGDPGSGTSTLLRSIAVQALRHGDVLIVEGGGTGEYAFLAGRVGVAAVECSFTGAVAALDWAARETERRLIAANHARQAGLPAPPDTRRPLWILVDRPSALGHPAAADGRPDPQELLHVPLRHGRAAQVIVVVAEQTDYLDSLTDAVRDHTRARVALGPLPAGRIEAVLGGRPPTTPVPHIPPGRGYARLGTGPVLRIQVPATPDPYDEATSEHHREAVLELLPERHDELVDEPAADRPQVPIPAEPAEPAEPTAGPADRNGADGRTAPTAGPAPVPAEG